MRIELGHDHDEPEIGLIALIDCIFFLLMFFMVATSFKQQVGQKEARELPIVLPSSDASLKAGAAAANEPLTIGVDAQGQFYVGTLRHSVQQLHDRLRAEARAEPNRPIRIEGDRRTSYQHIVHVLDLCAFEGLQKVSLRTRP
jgi:biopolymer transport protein ExbD